MHGSEITRTSYISVGSTDDGDRFEIDGNVLRFKSTPDGMQGLVRPYHTVFR